METKPLGAALRGPIGARRLEQVRGAGDIGFDKGPRPVDRAVDVAFGREMHDAADLLFAQQRADQRLIADVAFDEAMVRRAFDFFEAGQRARIGELVQGDDALAGSD